MATKSKNYLYNPGVKGINLLLMMASVAVIIIVLMQMAVSEVSIYDRTYYHSSDFERSYGRLIHNATEKHLALISEEAILADKSLTQSVRNDSIDRLRIIDSNLSGNPSFQYLLVNRKDNTTYSNIDNSGNRNIEYIQGWPTSVYFEYGNYYYPEGSKMIEYLGDDWNYWYYRNGYFGNYGIIELLDQANVDDNDWVLYTAITGQFTENDTFFYDNMLKHDAFKALEPLYITGIILAAVFLILTLIVFLVTTGRNSQGDLISNAFDTVSFEVQAFIAGVSVVPLLLYLENRPYGWGNPEFGEILLITGLGLIILVGALLFLASVIRNIKNHQFWANTLVVRCLKWLWKGIRKAFGFVKPPSLEEGYKWRVLMWIGIWVISNLVAIGIMTGIWLIGLPLFFGINAFSMWWIMKVVEDLKKINDTVHARRLGDQGEAIDYNSLQPMFRGLGEDIECLQEGLEVAVEERLKGEKMKTELITNVTHDLKTPLTSIVSYVELLKGKTEMDEEAKGYVGILDEKAMRLKVLIEQLVEAAKASSGSVAVNMMDLDLVQMVRQLCGEYQETMDERQLQCVHPELNQPMMVKADPMVLHRILDNIMSNVCKYAMAGTRVYLALEEDKKGVILSVKNISKEPLTMGVDALSQRFTRGDSARNTEGSGLGISIALSLAKLIKADLKFKTDGDLFKAEMVMKKGQAVESGEVQIIADEV